MHHSGYVTTLRALDYSIEGKMPILRHRTYDLASAFDSNCYEASLGKRPNGNFVLEACFQYEL